MAKVPHNERNLESESSGLHHLLNSDPRLIKPTLKEKRSLLEILEYPNKYTRSFDLVRLNVDNFSQVKSKEDFVLIKVKVTRAKLVNFPKGFFFGMTENEENLMRDLEGYFLLCLISINPESLEWKYLTYTDLQNHIKTRRIQFQINL
jgi:hypothetical protein